ncbi:MAG: hypothetical protein Kow0077_17180 [Anaerolineae bacterium]
MLAIPGVDSVNASSAFHQVEITYDPDQVDEQQLTHALDVAGYLQDLQVPLESGTPAYAHAGNGVYFRHTRAFRETRHTVSFGQQTGSVGRGLWPCPGIGPIRRIDAEE